MNSTKRNIDSSHSQSTSQTNTDEVHLSDDADTIRLVALEYNDKLSIDEDPAATVVMPFDPYNHGSVKSQDDRPRRSIDDMRKLSAEIAKTKHYVPKRK